MFTCTAVSIPTTVKYATNDSHNSRIRIGIRRRVRRKMLSAVVVAKMQLDYSDVNKVKYTKML